VIVKIPGIIQIGSHHYRVYFDEREEDGDFRGSALHRYHEILLNPNLHREQLRVTFLHEVLHIISQVFEVRPPEDDIVRLAEGLASLLFNNLSLDFEFEDVPTRVVEGRGS